MCCSMTVIFNFLPEPVCITSCDSGPDCGMDSHSALPWAVAVWTMMTFPEALLIAPQGKSVVVEVKREGWELWIITKWVVAPWSNVGEKEKKVTELFLLQLSVMNLCLSNEIKEKKNQLIFSFFTTSPVYCELNNSLWELYSREQLFPCWKISQLKAEPVFQKNLLIPLMICFRLCIILSRSPYHDLLYRGKNSVLLLVRNRL